MIEVTLEIVAHADSLHDPARAKIVSGGEGNDFLDSHRVKTKRQGCTCSLLRVPLTPAVKCQSPANLHTRRKRKRVGRYVESNKAHKVLCFFQFGSPQSEAFSSECLFEHLDHGLRLRTAKGRRKELHHTRICIQAGKRLDVGRLPPAEN